MNPKLTAYVCIAGSLVGAIGGAPPPSKNILSAIHYTTVGTGNFQTQWVFIDTVTGVVQPHLSMDGATSSMSVPAVITPDNGAIMTLSGEFPGPGSSLRAYGTLKGTLQIPNSTAALLWDSKQQRVIALTKKSEGSPGGEACVAAINIPAKTSASIACLSNVTSYLVPLALDSTNQELFIVTGESLNVVHLESGELRTSSLSCAPDMISMWWESGSLVAVTQSTQGNLTLSDVDVETGKCAVKVVLPVRAPLHAQVAMAPSMDSLAYFDGPQWAQDSLVSINLRTGNVSHVRIKGVPSAGNFAWLGYPSPKADATVVVV